MGEGVSVEDSDRKNSPRFMIKHMYRLRKNIMDWLPSLNDIEQARKQLDQLEAKAELADAVEALCAAFGGTTALHWETPEKIIEWHKSFQSGYRGI